MTITRDIQTRVATIVDEMNETLLEREAIVEGVAIALVGHLHHCQLGPAGAAKSLTVRTAISHISDAVYWEGSLDETTDKSQVFGPTDVRAFVEDGKSRTVTEGMLPEATHAMVDEILNANTPLLHAMQPLANERFFHDGALRLDAPLRVIFAGTNKMTADGDLLPFFDRLHLRYTVDYLRARMNQEKMVFQALKRMRQHGRGRIGAAKTTVTVAELDTAHDESLDLPWPDDVATLFFDVAEELGNAGMAVSDRRKVEGAAAVMATAWVRGHEEINAGDLDTLAHMWWTKVADAPEARNIILAAVNPGEKAGMDLLDELDKIAAEVKAAVLDDSLDPDVKIRVATKATRDLQRAVAEANRHRESAIAGGTSTARLNQAIERATSMQTEIGAKFFGLAAA